MLTTRAFSFGFERFVRFHAQRDFTASGRPRRTPSPWVVKFD
jgi:hypothetical protein